LANGSPPYGTVNFGYIATAVGSHKRELVNDYEAQLNKTVRYCDGL